jgi:hypothetical protein
MSEEMHKTYTHIFELDEQIPNLDPKFQEFLTCFRRRLFAARLWEGFKNLNNEATVKIEGFNSGLNDLAKNEPKLTFNLILTMMHYSDKPTPMLSGVIDTFLQYNHLPQISERKGLRISTFRSGIPSKKPPGIEQIQTTKVPEKFMEIVNSIKTKFKKRSI